LSAILRGGLSSVLAIALVVPCSSDDALEIRYKQFMERWYALRNAGGANSDLPQGRTADASRRPTPADVARAARFNAGGPGRWLVTRAKPGVYLRFTDRMFAREGLPFGDSDLVVVSTVTDVSVGLSLDETSLFSVVRSTADEIVHGPSALLAEGSEFIATRRGGALQTEQGIVATGDEHEMIPRPGRRYVLFLKAVGRSSDFDVVAGFDISDAAVTPLELDIQAMPFSEMSVPDFLAALSEAAGRARISGRPLR